MRSTLLVCGVVSLVASACTPPDPDPDAAGVPCTDDSECGGGVCRLTGSALRCSTAGGALAGTACSTDGQCASGLCEAFLCQELCSTCGDGAACRPLSITREGATRELQVCQPFRHWPSLELGGVATDATGSAEITFTLPEGVAAFTVLLEGDPMQRMAVTRLVAPDGTVLLDTSDQDADLNPGTLYVGAASVLVPSSDVVATRPRAGVHRMTVATYALADVVGMTRVAGMVLRVAVLMEPVGQAGGTLDLALGISPGSGLSGMAGQITRDAAVSQLRTSLRAAGVALGAVEFHDLPAEFDTVADGDTARRLCTGYSRAGPHGTSVNVFAVDVLSFAGGFSGGIPGPPGVYSAPASGIVLGALGSGRDTGILMAHEVMHFLGLRHTTELNGARDVISDTPFCASGTEVANCPDYLNLMFPTFPLRPDLTLSAGQQRVLMGSPWLWESILPNACAGGTTVDITGQRVARADARAADSTLAGSCGGSTTPERVFLWRTTDTVPALRLEATGARALYVRRATCTEPADLACESGDGTGTLVATVTDVEPGAYFVVVEGEGYPTLNLSM
jgi:hypothetical protein